MPLFWCFFLFPLPCLKSLEWGWFWTQLPPPSQLTENAESSAAPLASMGSDSEHLQLHWVCSASLASHLFLLRDDFSSASSSAQRSHPTPRKGGVPKTSSENFPGVFKSCWSCQDCLCHHRSKNVGTRYRCLIVRL